MTDRLLIEEAFPLRRVSQDSQHEQRVSQGKPNSLLYWPARRPLAASRAALIAALVPDPGDEHSRDELCSKIESITRWGSESGPSLAFLRDEIRLAYNGRRPRVLDPFAGGGSIPLEAMRLGCEVIANDLNPVAWFIQKCTLEFPQRLARKTHPLPKSGGTVRPAPDEDSCTVGEATQLSLSQLDLSPQSGDLAAHVYHWGQWVLEHARGELAVFYPDVHGLPIVAYLWARTVPCPDPACGATVPLLKTLWLCRRRGKRRALRLVPDSVSRQIDFQVWSPAESDEVPPGTMAGAKCQCPVCGVSLTPQYIRECGHQRRMDVVMTAVVENTPRGKEYRAATKQDMDAARKASEALGSISQEIPGGIPTEPLPEVGTLGFRVPLYGFRTWADLFLPRQLLALMTLAKWSRSAGVEMGLLGYPQEWIEAVQSYLTLIICKLADYGCTGATWQSSDEAVGHLFTGAKLPMTWDFVEVNPIGESVSSYHSHLTLQQRVLKRLVSWPHRGDPIPTVCLGDATDLVLSEPIDLIVTDPPYYDEVPYADVSDFFYVWIKRVVGDRYSKAFGGVLTPKNQELVEHGATKEPGRRGKVEYAEGMSKAFRRAYENLAPTGHMVVVFAHKEPDAWDTLVEAIIQSGFVVTASWPIDTEKRNRARAMNSAALSSSTWLVCRKRPSKAGVGRYSTVRKAMQERITERLRFFWDTGVSGPDFVWAAVGPALESYSSYDEVRRLDGSPFTVSEFLREVRRLVADFCLGRILHGRSTEGMDEATRYYLMHRSYFGLEPAPMGECILLSQGYGLDINDLRSQAGLLRGAEGSDLRLSRWDERKRDGLGDASTGGVLPLVDALHRLMHLWEAGDLDHLNAYVTEKGLRENELFWAVAQAILEMAKPGSRERTLIEALVAWGRGKASANGARQERLPGTGV